VAIKRDQADVWFSKAIRARDGKCVYCGRTDTLEAAHIYGRRLRSVRWSMDNCVTLCHYHHRHFTEQPIEFRDWLIRLYGEGHMELLREKSRAIFKSTAAIRKEIAKHYRGEVRRKEADSEYALVSYN
jgi:5-methylcytosine-specific restriction endonuclease McrA